MAISAFHFFHLKGRTWAGLDGGNLYLYHSVSMCIIIASMFWYDWIPDILYYFISIIVYPVSSMVRKSYLAKPLAVDIQSEWLSGGRVALNLLVTLLAK